PPRERPPPVPEPAATDELLRHPLEVGDVVPVAGPHLEPRPERGLDLGEEGGEVLPGPRRGRPREDRRDEAMDAALDEDLPVAELELLEVLVLLPEGVPDEEHDRGEHPGEDVLVAIRPEPAGIVHDQPPLPPDDEHVLERVREPEVHLP